MPNIEYLLPITEFTKQFSTKLGVKPNSIKVTIDRNQSELIEAGVVFKTKGKTRMIDTEKFMSWYLNH